MPAFVARLAVLHTAAVPARLRSLRVPTTRTLPTAGTRTEIRVVPRAEWRDHGAPLLSTHINGATVIHPLVRLLRDLESDAAAAARSVFLDPATAEKRKPGGQVGSARAKDRIGAARRDRHSATGLDPRVYGSMPVFDDEGNPVPLVTKAGATRVPRRAD